MGKRASMISIPWANFTVIFCSCTPLAIAVNLLHVREEGIFPAQTCRAFRGIQRNPLM